jgi:hypothetical protein
MDMGEVAAIVLKSIVIQIGTQIELDVQFSKYRQSESTLVQSDKNVFSN